MFQITYQTNVSDRTLTESSKSITLPNSLPAVNEIALIQGYQNVQVCFVNYQQSDRQELCFPIAPNLQSIGSSSVAAVSSKTFQCLNNMVKFL